VSEVEFLPAWYPRRRKRRLRLLMLVCVFTLFAIGFAAQQLWN
jgi:hypothetical protein